MTMVDFKNQRLSKKAMNQLKGGTIFTCHCQSYIANPPYKAIWTEDYQNAQEMADALNARCKYGGTCTQGGSIDSSIIISPINPWQ